MIDKEKILDFLKKKHENFSKQYEETKDYILDSLALEYSLLWSIISMGKLDIEQTKETCKWTLYSKSREYKTHDYFVRTKSECGRKTDEYADFGFSEYAPYCPYCGKEIDEVKHA